MADITTPQIVRFANERARVFADILDACYLTAKRFQQDWAALVATITVPSTADNIADGSDIDGRLRMTANQLQALKTQCDTIVSWFETGTPTRIAQIQQVCVNGRASF